MQAIDRLRVFMGSEHAPNGGFCHYRFFAATEWVDMRLPSAYFPVENPNQPIMCEVNGEIVILRYYDQKFRHKNGNPWTQPARWAYIRLHEDVWNGQAWVLGTGTVSPSPTKPDLVQTLTVLGQYHSKTEIMDALDKVPTFGGPGAPL